ncbi:alpha-hydroxy acid oxidase [Streptomyces sp. NPDC051677]|uniref:alpha-hydroxy acid oxidase n=1 Tax=Streptomyces sp. NPDC051677 TaxID=3365669 RepID=UPI0037CD8B85
MNAAGTASPIGAGRQFPRWSQLGPLLRVDLGGTGARARLRRAPDVAGIREIARRRVPQAVFDYVDGAAEGEVSIARSRDAFDSVEFRPRVLVDVAEPDPSTTILGRPARMPVVLAPTGFTRLMHHQGEYAVAAAAATAAVPYTLSTMGTVTPERLSETRPDGADQWFQLYLWRDRGRSAELVARAREAGFRTLVLTVDTPVAGARLRDVRNGFSVPPKLTPRTLMNMSRHPGWWANLLTTEPLTFASLTETGGTVADLVGQIFDPHVTITDLEWLRGQWQGPLVVKGVQTVADARLVVDAGADAVVVSNHGGRQLDRATTPLEELPAVVREISERAEVYIDGGVRTGADVVAAVALGARACLIGRPYLYGLMAGGQAGVSRVLDILHADMTRTLALLGTPMLKDLDGDSVRFRRQR